MPLAFARPDQFEVVGGIFRLAGEAVGGESEEGGDFAADGFEGLGCPDVADARDEIAMGGFELHTFAPA